MYICNGASPIYNRKVVQSIKKIPKRIKACYIALTERMAEKGPDLGMPHTCAMGKGLFEIRVKAEESIARFFYCIQVKNEIVILHTFIKKTQQTPIKELDLARKRLHEVKNNG